MLPGEFVAKFQTIAEQRLDRIETAWAQLVTRVDDRAASVLHHELHTLKGEAQVVGMDQVSLVTHKLEDLAILARDRGYAIDDEIDLIVRMAIRFIATLTRRRPGAQSGLDIPAFVRQIESVLRDSNRGFVHVRTQTGVAVPLSRDETGMSVRARTNLASPAIEAYIEYASARGVRRNRLRAAWHMMRDLAGIHRATLGVDQFQKHLLGAQALAQATRKPIDVQLAIPSVEVTSKVLAAVDVATLHLIRNAIDHGIEPVDQRVAAGKPPSGTIRVTAKLDHDLLVVQVSDDGRGVDFAKVKARALELDLIDPAEDITQERWVELLWQLGFSTRDRTDDVSGRGVGLDVVRNQVVGLAGTLEATSTPGAGMTWTITVVVPPLVLSGVAMKVTGLSFPVVFENWAPATTTPPDEPFALDIGRMLGLTDGMTPRTNVVTFVRDAMAMSISCETTPRLVEARRLVNGGPKALYEVVLVNEREALLVHPELLINL
jgi:signal transduction histidine kinase